MTGVPINPLGPLGAPEAPQPPKPPRPPGPEGERSFLQIFQEQLDRVNQLQQEADQNVVKMKDGEATDEEVYLSIVKAKTAFDALTEIRNKLIDAFEELQRMRI
jgi:flagellar hook-basal body complex protein FliE